MPVAALGPSVTPPARLSRVDRQGRFAPETWLVLAGVAALLIPTLLSLGRDYWSTENGAHGPIILASGAWLVWRERQKLHFRPGAISGWWLAALLPALLLLYAYGRSFSVLFLETSALYLLLILLGCYYWGVTVMRRMWFAILYLGFLIKPPSSLVAELTQPLKIWISETAVGLLHALGYPVGNSGVAIQIAQYELLVQQACAGLGSIVTLLAIGLLYLHLTGQSRSVRSLLLLLSIIPIAVLANFIRVIALILLTFHAGNGVAQSFAHDLAGVVTFILALTGLLTFDTLLHLRRPSMARSG